MRVWTVKDGEQLPLFEGSRPYRTRLLSEALAERGHQVTWFHSTFSHQHKKLFYTKDHLKKLNDNLSLQLIHAGSYPSNFSIRRYLHHRRLARGLAKHIRTLPKPDIIVCAYPIVEVCNEFLTFAKENGIPILVDIRDLWPDIFYDRLPHWMQPFLRVALHDMTQKAKRIFTQADGLISVTEGILHWALNYAERSKGSNDAVFYLVYPKSHTDYSLVSPEIKALVKQLAGKKLFSYIGAWGEVYNNQIICDVVKSIDNPDIHFILGGKGDFTPLAQAQLQDQKNATFTGWLNKHEVAYLLEHTYATILPWQCVNDAMPNKFFEYLSFAQPIITSATGEMEKVVNQHEIGFYYSPQSLPDLQKAISTLANNPSLRQSFSDNARALSQNLFDCDINMKHYADHVEKVAQLYHDEKISTY